MSTSRPPAAPSPLPPTTPLVVERRWYHVSLSGTLGLFSLTCLVIGRFADENPGLLALLWKCPFKLLSGLPCFTCGITRIYLLLGRGEVWEAFQLAPLPFLIATGSLVVGAWHLYARLRNRPWPDQVLGRLVPLPAVRWSAPVLFFTLWGYAIVRSLHTGAP